MDIIEYARNADIARDPLVADLTSEVGRLREVIASARIQVDAPDAQDKYGTHTDRRLLADILDRA